MTPFFRPSSASLMLYPDTDDLPSSENTLQYEWIVKIKNGMSRWFAEDQNVFVAAGLFWYAVEGNPAVRIAPDVMVAFGRPQGHRLRYLQWEEADVVPQVVFEIVSATDTLSDVGQKLDFYRRFGVEECYVIDVDIGVKPHRVGAAGYVREGGTLHKIASMDGHISPRLGVRFDTERQRLQLFHPDGQLFLTALELSRRYYESHQPRAGQMHT